MDDILEISAIHEAAHGVIKWRLACDVYGAVNDAAFDVITLRTEAEFAIAPYIDAQGRAHHCSGVSEMSCFYTATGPLDDAVPDFAATPARRKMGHDIMVMLAGPLAEARARGCAVEPLFEPRQAGFQDWQRALQTILRMHPQGRGARPADRGSARPDRGVSLRPRRLAHDWRPRTRSPGPAQPTTHRQTSITRHGASLERVGRGMTRE